MELEQEQGLELVGTGNFEGEEVELEETLLEEPIS